MVTMIVKIRQMRSSVLLHHVTLPLTFIVPMDPALIRINCVMVLATVPVLKMKTQQCVVRVNNQATVMYCYVTVMSVTLIILI